MASGRAASRDTSVVVVVLETDDVYIVSSLSTRKDTQIIYVDQTTGALSHAAKTGSDKFMSEDEALRYVTDGSRWLCKSTTYGKAILGYAILGNFGLLLVATKLSTTVPNMPGGGCVCTVMESQWIKIQLRVPHCQGKGEQKNIQELAELNMDEKYYFCETRDITRPFPSKYPISSPDEEFVWNKWLSHPFQDIGLSEHCVVLLQGFAECRYLGGSDQQEVTLALIARRSRLHPGTRYLARGLNACFSTGNEVECEQLVWVSKRSSKRTPFTAYVWRRGTIPIWWGAELKMTAAEAEIYVASRNPYKGSLQYYKRLSKRYDAKNRDEMIKDNQKGSHIIPLYCVNLLRNGEGKSEAILVEHFAESINYIRSTRELPNTRINLINYDWHTSVKYNGEQKTIEGLWKLLKMPTASIGFCQGEYVHLLDELKSCKGILVCIPSSPGGFCLSSSQNGVIRYNCADSLDRTNAASYFGALQALVEQCCKLGHSIDVGGSSIRSSSRLTEPSNYSGHYGPLPPGWEKRSDAVSGKTYYIDHNTRKTTWEHPCSGKPYQEKEEKEEKTWKCFDMTFEEFKFSTTASAITSLADLFLLAGDIHATLYTGSKAMHSQILHIFNDDSGSGRTGRIKQQISVAQNMKITLQRRFQNVVVDGSKQKQLEMLLGMRLFKHFPSIAVHPLNVLSRPPACFLKPIPSMFPSTNDVADLLNIKKKDMIWVCPIAEKTVEVFIYLGEPCHVCQILLTLTHGAEDLTLPSMVDVRTGRYLDELKLVVEGVTIPRCANGTNIVIPLSGVINSEDMAITGAGARLQARERSFQSMLYEFEELEGKMDFLTRIVALTFYPSAPRKIPITLGEIEILGIALPWGDVLKNEGYALKHIELDQKPKETNPFLSDSDFGSLHYSPSEALPPVTSHPSGLLGQGLDLLTGEEVFIQTDVQPETRNISQVGSNGFFDSLGDNLLNQQDFVVHDSGVTVGFPSGHNTEPDRDTRVEHYLDCVKQICGHNMAKKTDFEGAMKLEIERFRSNISAAERDRALLSVGIDPALLDPNGLLAVSDMSRLCKVANNLTLLGHIVSEDSSLASISLDVEEDSSVDFWNITGIRDSCYGDGCDIQCQTVDQHVSLKSPLFLCSLCQRKSCKVCISGRGSTLLLNRDTNDGTHSYNPSLTGSSYSGPSDGISTNRAIMLDGFICRSCCPDLILDALLLDYVRVLSSRRRKARADEAAFDALKRVLGPSKDFTLEAKQREDSRHSEVLDKLLKGEQSLAEFPFSSFLQSVETASGSAPQWSLLTPLEAASTSMYWRAPSSSTSIEFSIVLGSLSVVSGITLIVSPIGFSTFDVPIVQIWASNMINKDERSCVGKWDVGSLIAGSPEYYGPENPNILKKEPRHVRFSFRTPVKCRLIWILLTLRPASSSSVSLDKGFSLLSFDEDPLSQLSRRNSYGGRVENAPCIHAKKIIVTGIPVRIESKSETLYQGSEIINQKAFLDRPPPLARFKVPIESERLTDNDCVLDQYLSPSAPGLAGFRLDAFNITRPRITHSPDPDLKENQSLIRIDERHIVPALLIIQVTVLQGSQEVTIAEHRLPEIRPNTPMYFDFPRPVQAQRVTFRLLGDLAAFADDPVEQSDSSLSGHVASASGLSLNNRIKIYYYAEPYELGKWASLSAV